MKAFKKYYFLLMLFFSAAAFSQQTKERLPNIIYIYADDLGYAELGSYGQQKIKTPNLDRMAKEGMKFTQHYAPAPVCAPSRCMLMTGKHGGHSYIRGNYELGGFEDSTEGGQMPLPEGMSEMTFAGVLGARRFRYCYEDGFCLTQTPVHR